MLARGRRASGAGGQRSPHARSLHRSRPGAAVVAGAQSVVELGPRFRQPVPRSRSGRAGGSSITIRSRCWPKCRWRRSSVAPANWCCTAGSTTPTGGSGSICKRTGPGAPRTPAFCGRGRWRISRPSSDCTSRCRSIPAAWACWPAITSRARRTSDIPLIGIGLFYGQGYFRQRLDRNGWQQEEYLQTDVNQLPMEPAIGTNGEPVMVQIETRSGAIRGARSGA